MRGREPWSLGSPADEEYYYVKWEEIKHTQTAQVQTANCKLQIDDCSPGASRRRRARRKGVGCEEGATFD